MVITLAEAKLKGGLFPEKSCDPEAPTQMMGAAALCSSMPRENPFSPGPDRTPFSGNRHPEKKK